MTAGALILTYHAIEPGPAPICVDPNVFSRHLDCILESGARVVTVAELAEAVRADAVSERTVAISFDDGFASVSRTAAPLLAERGLSATVFCVAGRLGGRSDWGGPWPRGLSLASADELASLTQAGWEIGSHGLGHESLRGLPPADVLRELSESKQLLEDAAGQEVRSFAYPYGIVPDGAADALRLAGYDAACTTRLALVSPGADPLDLPRVDAHYTRRPVLLRAALRGRLDFYLGTRRLGARARRLVRPDDLPVQAR